MLAAFWVGTGAPEPRWEDWRAQSQPILGCRKLQADICPDFRAASAPSEIGFPACGGSSRSTLLEYLMGREQDLILAVKNGDVTGVQKLVAKVKAAKTKLLGSTKRLNVNYQDADGFSALHHAALGGSLELIALLLEAQATVDIKDSNGETPREPATRPCGRSLLPLQRSNANSCWHRFSGLANASPLQSPSHVG
ncbi:Caskin-2 [Myotis davidii]|uniref:Caskin-2 n=1 Tax=Myotis davidii TaxID=225400 RepID=L5LZT7_MYODS|nr:Caskin-2 [Myotis davidii]